MTIGRGTRTVATRSPGMALLFRYRNRGWWSDENPQKYLYTSLLLDGIRIYCISRGPIREGKGSHGGCYAMARPCRFGPVWRKLVSGCECVSQCCLKGTKDEHDA